MSMLESTRLFIALALPEAVKDELLRIQQLFDGQLPRGAIRWTAREQLHITLKFLGNVSSEHIGALTTAIRAAAADHPSLQLRLESVGAFPNLGRPRVIWTRAADAGAHLPVLHRAVEHAVRPFTSEDEERHYSAHATFGRVKQLDRSHIRVFATLALDHARHLFGEWTATTIEIVGSELGRSGARHDVIASLPLYSS